MTNYKKFLNYFGQFRVYSFIDLFLLLVAAHAPISQMIGALLLWLGFIIYLEEQHKHDYRLRLPLKLWILFAITGLLFYWRVEGVFFVLASYIYTKKDDKYFALFAPFFRGLQNFFLIGGIIGYHNILTWLSLVLILVRNAVADFRDVEKDSSKGMKTIPVVFGIKKNIKYIHLIALMGTSFAWWHFSGIGIQYLVFVWIVQVFSYNLTPR